MRHLVSKLLTTSMVAGAVLMVSACGEKATDATNTTTELNETDPMMDGTANDTMTDGDAMMNVDDSNMADSNMAGSNVM